MGIESGLPDIIADEEALHGAPAETKKSRKKSEPETPVSASASSANTIALSHPVPKKQSAKSAAYGTLLVILFFSYLTMCAIRCSTLYPPHRGTSNVRNYHKSCPPTRIPSLLQTPYSKIRRSTQSCTNYGRTRCFTHASRYAH